MKKETKRKLLLATASILALAGGIGLYKYIRHTPQPAYNPSSRRARFRADGVPKKAFKTPEGANFQVIKQFVLHGEICSSYSLGDEYFTGHPRNSLRSINPLKLRKKSA